METINALGLKCPTPLIQTKRYLDTVKEGTVCTLVDDDMALPNLMDYAKSQGFDARYEERENHWAIYTTKRLDSVAAQAGADFVMVITGTGIGRGSGQLGALLMEELVQSISSMQPMPATLIFMNAGILLNVEGSGMEETLLELEAQGVEVITCGTCLDFYGMKDALLTGRIGNMYVILEKMAQAAKVWHVAGESALKEA